VVDAKDELDDAQDEFDRYKDLDEDDADRTRAEEALEDARKKYNQAVRDRDLLINDLDQARADDAAAQTRLADAARAEADRRAGPDPDRLALAQARLDNAQAQLAAAQAALDKLELKAPFAGKIVEINIAVGEQALPNQAVMVLADVSAWYVETTDLTENEVVKLSVGQKVSVVPDALKSLTLPGEIVSISDTYIEKAGDVTYEARILLTETDPLLRWGMTVEVQFVEAKP
jgi:multidrug resistance efflux pump